MSKQLFTKKQVMELSNDKYVVKVSEKAITYSNTLPKSLTIPLLLRSI